jgi:hypothetical protein
MESNIGKTRSLPQQMESPSSPQSSAPDDIGKTWSLDRPKPHNLPKPPYHGRKLYTPSQVKRVERETVIIAQPLRNVHRTSGYAELNAQPVIGVRRATDNRGRIRRSEAYYDDDGYEEVEVD